MPSGIYMRYVSMLLEPRPALMHSQAFVIYVFLQLLITYLGGERSLLITLHGRPPIPHPFPFNWFMSPMDVSDPWTLLKLKRGVLRKSLLARSIMPRELSAPQNTFKSNPCSCSPRSSSKLPARIARETLLSTRDTLMSASCTTPVSASASSERCPVWLSRPS